MEAYEWDDDFLDEIGLGDLVDGHHAKIGRSVAFPGHPLDSDRSPAWEEGDCCLACCLACFECWPWRDKNG